MKSMNMREVWSRLDGDNLVIECGGKRVRIALDPSLISIVAGQFHEWIAAKRGALDSATEALQHKANE